MSKNTDLYPYDSSEDEDEELFFSRSNMEKAVREVQKTAIDEGKPLVTSYILTETAYALLNNSKSNALYREKKAKLHKELKVETPVFFDQPFYKFIPSLVIYNKSSDASYKESLFREFYKRFKKDINAFIATNYLSKALDVLALDEAISESRAKYEKLVNECSEDLLKYHNDNNYGSCNIEGIRTLEPKFNDRLKSNLAGAKHNRKGQKENPTERKITNFIKTIISDSSFEKFFEFLSTTKAIDPSDIGLDQSEILKSLISKKDLELYLVQDLLLARFDTKGYVSENDNLNMELRNHLSTQAFHESFYEHAATVKLDDKIIRYTQKVTAFEELYKTVLPRTTTLPLKAMKAFSTTTLYSKGTRSDYTILPLKTRSSAYEALSQNELKDKVYTSNLIKAIIHDQVIDGGNWQDGFLYKLTDLLFNCEPTRGVSAYLTNAMFFELVDAGIYEMNELVTRLPSAKGGAVDAYRYMNDLLGGTYSGSKKFLTTRQYYDHKEGDEKEAKDLAIKDTILFLDWLIYKGVLDKDSLIAEAEGTKLGDATKMAYTFLRNLEFGNIQTTLEPKLAKLLELINAYLSKIILPSSAEEAMATKEEKKDEEEEKDDKSSIADLVFKALHNLIYEWYGIHLEHLYPAKKFEKDQKEQFVSDNSDKVGSVKELEVALKEENGDLSKAFKAWKLNTWKYASPFSVDSEDLLLGQDITKNAFNQRENRGYHYQASDIKAIQSILMQSYLEGFMIHEPIGDNSSIDTTLISLITSLDPAKPTLCVYNLGNWHWVTFAAVKIGDGNTTILYKDSHGVTNLKFEAKLKEINKDIEFVAHLGREQPSGLDCGIFALRNMELMAEFLKTLPLGGDLKGEFLKLGFCTLGNAQDLRKSEFAAIYVQARYQQILNDKNKVAQREALKGHHEEELDRLKAVLDGKEEYDILILKGSDQLGADRSKTISIEIALPADLDFASAEYTYTYRISHTNELDIDVVIAFIQTYLALGKEDFLVDGKIIRIADNKLSRIGQVGKVSLQDIEFKTQEVTLEELYKDLGIVEENTVDFISAALGEIGAKAGSSIAAAMAVELKGPSNVESENIGEIHPYFAKYTLNGLSNILKLRLNELQLENIKVLGGVFLDDANNIADLLSIITDSETQTILLPINLFNKHAVGLIFEKNDNGKINITYFDSLNNPIPGELKELIVKQLNITKGDFAQFEAEQQKYANCGSELVENFMLYLLGERLSQEEAVEEHSELVKYSLLTILDDGSIIGQNADPLAFELLGEAIYSDQLSQVYV